MALAMFFLKELGLTDIDLHINSIGCEVCRDEYKEALKDFLEKKRTFIKYLLGCELRGIR